MQLKKKGFDEIKNFHLIKINFLVENILLRFLRAPYKMYHCIEFVTRTCYTRH